jgi:hypothetical protein
VEVSPTMQRFLSVLARGQVSFHLEYVMMTYIVTDLQLGAQLVVLEYSRSVPVWVAEGMWLEA